MTTAVPLPMFLGALAIVAASTDDRLIRLARRLTTPSRSRLGSSKAVKRARSGAGRADERVLRRASEGADEVLRTAGLADAPE